MLTRQDWLLLALSKSPGGALSPVQIQKALFLFNQEAGGSIGTNSTPSSPTTTDRSTRRFTSICAG